MGKYNLIMGNNYPSWKMISHAEEKNENTYPQSSWWGASAASSMEQGGYFHPFTERGKSVSMMDKYFPGSDFTFPYYVASFCQPPFSDTQLKK